VEIASAYDRLDQQLAELKERLRRLKKLQKERKAAAEAKAKRAALDTFIVASVELPVTEAQLRGAECEREIGRLLDLIGAQRFLIGLRHRARIRDVEPQISLDDMPEQPNAP
jgi:hypothetical protein